LLEWCLQFNFTHIFTLGDIFASVSENMGVTTPNTMEKLGNSLRQKAYKNTAFLIKGSRGMKMESVLAYL
jgi:UDP-N-acetylmuramyl pentapeptide synthase